MLNFPQNFLLVQQMMFAPPGRARHHLESKRNPCVTFKMFISSVKRQQLCPPLNCPSARQTGGRGNSSSSNRQILIQMLDTAGYKLYALLNYNGILSSILGRMQLQGCWSLFEVLHPLTARGKDLLCSFPVD